MNPAALCLSTFMGCFVGALVPLVNTELLVLAMSAAAPPSLALPLVLLAAGGQMLGKAMLYGAARGALYLPVGRISAQVATAAGKLEGRRNLSGGLLFISAASGLPPFYFTTIAAGLVRISFARFLLFGMGGRTLRFAAVIAFPQLIKSLL